MNDVKFMDQVDETLQHEFSAAALASGRPAAQIVSELMRAYLSQTQEYVGDKPQPVAISTAERQRRYEASESATANVALEGFKQTKEAQAHAQRFINGEIDLKGYLAPSYEEIHGR